MRLRRSGNDEPSGRRFQMRQDMLSIGDDYWIEDEAGDKAFRVNGKEWRVPEGAVAVDDGFGGKSAYVTIRAAGPAQQ